MVLSHGRFLAFAVLMLPISYTVSGYLSYYDEIFVFVYFIYGILAKFRSFSQSDKNTIYILSGFYLLGFVFNFYSKIIGSFSAILIDAFTMHKQFIIYLILINILTKRVKRRFISTILPLVKVYIIVAFFFAIVSQFIDLGMTMGSRYNLKSFYFLSNNHSGFGITIIGCLLVLSASKCKKKHFLVYLLLSVISLLATTKGVIYSFITFSLVIYIFTRRGYVKTRHMVLLVSALLLVSSFQIKNYLFDFSSPRMILLSGGYQTANEYFPLGSGFATFGGEQARVHYSPLYYKYGLNKVYGLSEKNGIFLNDNYMAMIWAQTGYIGLLLYGIILFRIFQSVNRNKDISFRLKTFFIATLLMLYVSSIATGIIKSGNGVFLFTLLAILQSDK